MGNFINPQVSIKGKGRKEYIDAFDALADLIMDYPAIHKHYTAKVHSRCTTTGCHRATAAAAASAPTMVASTSPLPAL